MIRIFSLTVLLLLLASCGERDKREKIKWAPDGSPATDFYQWRTSPSATAFCGTYDLMQKGGCVATKRTDPDATAPAGARRMSDDSPVDEGTPGTTCFIVSTSSWASASREATAYLGDNLSHLEHEKNHCRGYAHQPASVLLGKP